ncbi:hypothetical protein WG66_004216, partial [Moniliophthora roreri]
MLTIGLHVLTRGALVLSKGMNMSFFLGLSASRVRESYLETMMSLSINRNSLLSLSHL